MLQSHFCIMYIDIHTSVIKNYSKRPEMIFITLIKVVTSWGYNYGDVRMDLPYFILYSSILMELFKRHLDPFIMLQWIK